MPDSMFDQEATTGGTEPGDDVPPAALGDTFEDLEGELEDEDKEDAEKDAEETDPEAE